MTFCLCFNSGYMAPEYAIDGQFSVKSDVFSFGILMLEIVIGKRNRGFYNPSENINLIGHVSVINYIGFVLMKNIKDYWVNNYFLVTFYKYKQHFNELRN